MKPEHLQYEKVLKFLNNSVTYTMHVSYTTTKPHNLPELHFVRSVCNRPVETWQHAAQK